MSKKDKLLASAQKSLQKGQVGKAIKDYQKIVQADPKDIRNRQKLAELLGRDSQVAAALEEYEAVAKHYAGGGFYLKAIAVYKQMQKLDGGQPEFYHHLAALNEKQGLVGNALAEYRNLVAHYEKQEMYSEALDVLQKMRELEPENLNVLVKIAETYAHTGQGEEARREFDEALSMLRKKGDFGRVLKLYEIFLPLFPDEPEMKIGLSRALIERGDAEKGIQLLQNLLKENPEHPQVLRTLAEGYQKTSNFENERLTWLHLLRHNPDDLDFREKALRASVRTGELQRARQEIVEWQERFGAAGKPEVALELLQSLEEDAGADAEELSVEDVEASSGADLAGPTRQPVDELTLDPGETAEVGEELELDDSLLALPNEEKEAGKELSGEQEDGGEEIPLEFLEAVNQDADLSVASEETEPEPEAVPAEPQSQAPSGIEEEEPEAEIELELEIDMDGVEGFEFDLEEVDEGLGKELEAEPAAGRDPEELEEVEELEELETLEEVEELEELAEVPEAEGEGDPLSMDDLLPAGEEALVDIRAELEEAEFYMQQGLLDEAERICRDLLETAPYASEIKAKLDLIAERRKQAAAPTEEMDGLFDLASEISEIGEDGFPALDEEQVGFADSQKGVRTEIDGEDTESHYNLGIAYKEMGLLDDAVVEFDKAMVNPDRRVDCLTLKGICLSESGAYDRGEEVFRAALTEELEANERISLQYELGLLYERGGRSAEALETFEQVAEADLFFRDVGERIESLRKALGMTEGSGMTKGSGMTEGSGDDEGGKGNKDRVSYV